MDINEWIDHISTPRSELGGMSVCPYVKKAKFELIETDGSDIRPPPWDFDLIIYILPDEYTIEDVTNIAIAYDSGIETVTIADDPATLDVTVSLGEYVVPVTSVNGKTGAVVIDYPDIGTNPVNHVRYVHVQNTISNSWTINHNLNFYPNVTILDNDTPPRIIEADIRYLDENSVRINMNVSMSGKAYLT
jgi:hypothetical protein